MNIATKLDQAIKAVCPIHGVSIGRADDKQTWRIDFKDEATREQREAGQSALTAFNPDDPKIEAVETIAKIEAENPITHRALRELILTLGEAFPAGKETVFYKKVLETELAIREERKKL
jgi:hypothetical protein